MTVLFDGEVHVHYGFLWFDTRGRGGEYVELVSARAGQTNGVLGAVEPGVLSMVTGMHTGLVPVRVEVLDAAPDVSGGWDDVVEASVDVRDTEVGFSAFDWSTTFALPTPGWYRARWSDSGMDAARDDERYDAHEPVVERCLLQLWPAPPGPDAILRETAASASYWHQTARDADVPPTPHERALSEERGQQERAEQQRRWEREEQLREWGGRDPSPRLREAVGTAGALVRERRDLVDDLERLDPDAQRTLVLELTGEICAAADGSPVDWGPVLAALRRGEPLPPPFDDRATAYRAAFPGEWTSTVTVTRVSFEERTREPLHPASGAVGAVLGAAEPDPLTAVLAVVEAVSWSAPDLDGWFAEVGRRVRALSAPSS